MLDPHAIAKSDQKVLLTFHEVNLEKVFPNGVAGFELECFVKPRDLICDRFFLNKNRTKIPVCSEGGDRRFVELAVAFPDPEKHVADEGGVDCLIDFECFHSLFCLRGVNTAQR